MLANPEDLSLVFSALPGPHVLVFPDAPLYTIAAVGDDYLRITGRRQEDLIGKGLFEAFPNNPADPNAAGEKAVRASLDYVLAHKTPHQMPVQRYDIKKQDGSFEERYWSTLNKPVLNNEGTVVYLIHTTEDVSVQIKAAQRDARLAGIEKAYTFFMNAPVIIGILRGDDYIIELANEGLLEVWNRTSQVVGKPLLQAIPELEPQGFLALLEQVRTTGQPFYAYEFPITLVRHGQEEVVYFDFVYKPFYENEKDKDGKAAGIISVGHDVTEQVKARQRFKNVVEQAADPILILKGEDLVLEVANQALFDLWQVGPDALNKPFLEILPEMKDQVFVELLKEVLHTGKPFHGEEVPAVFHRKDGREETVYFNFAYQPYREADGTISGVIVTANDITGQVQVKQQLVESERNFRNMILQSPVATCLLEGPSHVITLGNDRMFALMGRSAEEVLNKPLFEALPEVRNQGLEEVVQRVYTKGETFVAHERPVPLLRDGKVETVYVDFVYEPFRQGDGTISAIIAVAIDVTEKVRARKKMEESEQELQQRVQERTADLEHQRALVDSILNASISGIMALDAVRDENGEVVDFTLIKINKQLTRIIGLDESVVGQRYLSHFNNSLHNGIFAMYKTVVETGRPQRQEVYSTNLDLHHWFDISAASRGDSGIVVNFANISPQRQAAIQIEQQKNLLDSILKNSPSGITVYAAIRDADNRAIDFQCILTNDAAEVFTDISNVDRLTKTVLQISPGLKGSVQFQMGLNALESGESFRTQYCEPGSGRWLELTVVRMDENHLINVFTDITETKRTQMQLEETIASLKQANAELEQFTYVSHHDLQEPLRKISLFADMIRSESFHLLSEAAQKRFDKITDAANRMSMALRDVLNYASLNKEEQFTAIDLDISLADVQSDLELVIAEKNARILSDALPTIRAVPQQMHQLFYNLVNNALKFSRPGVPPVVSVRCRELDGAALAQHPELEAGRWYYEIIVQDNGIGFSAESADKIFGMFQRLHNRQTFAGTGIGLALCKKVVANHKGKIWAESEPDKGARFTVILPEA
ncbi:PAS domain-containing protein [Flavisolibacter sp. BT320]|nr:PAS domain-containing protein [Flavisolibacter longurius]